MEGKYDPGQSDEFQRNDNFDPACLIVRQSPPFQFARLKPNRHWESASMDPNLQHQAHYLA